MTALTPAKPPAYDAVLTRSERFAVFLVWIALAWAPALLLWGLTGYFGYFYSPMMIVLTLGFTAPFMGRIVGQVGSFKALPPTRRPLPHLPAPLVRLTEAAASVRDELALVDFEEALERAWRLTCEFDQLPPELRLGRDDSRAALTAVQALIDLRASPGRQRLSHAQQRARLADALTRFEVSLTEPIHTGYR